MKIKSFGSLLRGIAAIFFFWFSMILFQVEQLINPLLRLLAKMNVIGRKYTELYKDILHYTASGLLDIFGVKVVAMVPVVKYS